MIYCKIVNSMKWPVQCCNIHFCMRYQKQIFWGGGLKQSFPSVNPTNAYNSKFIADQPTNK